MKKHILISFLAFLLSCSNSTNQNTLKRFSTYNEKFRFFFRVNKNWYECTHNNGDFYDIVDNKLISNTKDFVITYRNGVFAYESKGFNSYPDQTTWMNELTPENVMLSKKELESGNDLATIDFKKSPILNQVEYYETSIKNISSKKFRVIKFGGFDEINSNSLTECYFFSASDFQNWYMKPNTKWIRPGETVSDPINYGVTLYWVYQIETSDGAILWISKLKK